MQIHLLLFVSCLRDLRMITLSQIYYCHPQNLLLFSQNSFTMLKSNNISTTTRPRTSIRTLSTWINIPATSPITTEQQQRLTTVALIEEALEILNQDDVKSPFCLKQEHKDQWGDQQEDQSHPLQSKASMSKVLDLFLRVHWVHISLMTNFEWM